MARVKGALLRLLWPRRRLLPSAGQHEWPAPLDRLW